MSYVITDWGGWRADTILAQIKPISLPSKVHPYAEKCTEEYTWLNKSIWLYCPRGIRMRILFGLYSLLLLEACSQAVKPLRAFVFTTTGTIVVLGFAHTNEVKL